MLATLGKFLPHLGSSIHVYKMAGVGNEPFELCESGCALTDQVRNAHQDLRVCSLVLPGTCHRGSRPGSRLLEREGEPFCLSLALKIADYLLSQRKWHDARRRGVLADGK